MRVGHRAHVPGVGRGGAGGASPSTFVFPEWAPFSMLRIRLPRRGGARCSLTLHCCVSGDEPPCLHHAFSPLTCRMMRSRPQLAPSASAQGQTPEVWIRIVLYV